jgi:hypothetical protein
MTTAATARMMTDSVVAKAARAPLDQVYAQVDQTAASGLGTTLIDFAPFTFPDGGSTDPAAAPFLNQLVTDGYLLTGEKSVDDGVTRLRLTW